MVSPLAEGADRLIVERVLLASPDARLIVPLPLPVSEYLQDFAAEGSRAEFESLMARAAEVIPAPITSQRSLGYGLAGVKVLEHSDVLIALWDGRIAQDRSGTEEMVSSARQLGLPLAWVHCGNRRPGTNLPTSLGKAQGCVTFERFK